jgi:hypothetical protein
MEIQFTQVNRLMLCYGKSVQYIWKIKVAMRERLWAAEETE